MPGGPKFTMLLTTIFTAPASDAADHSVPNFDAWPETMGMFRNIIHVSPDEAAGCKDLKN
jgi:hypothetical protein